MTDLLTHDDPNDTGEIPPPGEITAVIDTGEKTQRIHPVTIHASVVGAIPRRVIEMDDTVVYRLPATIGVVPDLADAQPIAPWGRVLDTAPLSLLGSVAGLDGELRPAAPGPLPTPLPPPPPPSPPDYVGRHRLSWNGRARRLLARAGVTGALIVAVWGWAGPGRSGRDPVTAPTPNAELAYKVLDHIDAHPEQWNQGVYLAEAECGTVGCFAGWTVLLSGATPNYLGGYRGSTAAVTFDGGSWAAPDLAEKLLGASRWVEAGDGYSEDIDLFDQANSRADLGRLVAEIFGPRPGGAS